MHLNGLRIVEHALAVDRVRKLVRHPIKKRRRNWRWIIEERPVCWQIGGTLFMHPELLAHLRQITGPNPAGADHE